MDLKERLSAWLSPQESAGSGSTLIVGLGNPGEEYQRTRHNIGFMVLDALADELDASFSHDKKRRAYIATTHHQEDKWILAKPQTFMNKSGESVAKLIGQYRPKRIIVVYDDATLDLGVIRWRLEGSAGGHNGIKSILQHVKGPFGRLKIGVGTPPDRFPMDKWVLARFAKEHQDHVLALIDTAVAHLIRNPYPSEPFSTQIDT